MKALNKYLKTHFDSLIANLGQYHQFQQADTAHRIRVDIKRIKSVLQVMEFSLRKYDSHEQYLPLRNIFRKAGLIRHPEVMLQLLIAHNLEGLPIGQLEDTRKHEETFREEIPFYIEQMTQHAEQTQKDVSGVRTKDLHRFLQKQMKSVKSRLYPVMKVRELHNVRKCMKHIIHLAALADWSGSKKLKFFVRMEDAIGKLHDKEALIDFLKPLSKKVDPQAVKVLRKACEKDRKAIAKRATKFYT